ncbi:MAG: Bifunctional oligoribonuclease and PAP phosphatase NrnA [Calditrichaeota bacterium]|nr:Bifunctional oligoribonuclease and PAP phosphatase NrnA [Calditrichota bacterium]
MALIDVVRALNAHQRFLVTTHQNPDGDAVGTLLAAGHLLRSGLGKYAVPVLPDPVPPRYRFLPGLDGLYTAKPAKKLAPYDAVLTVDVSTPDRIGNAAALVEPSMTSINIDHHVTNPGTGDACWVDTDAAATAEMMLVLYRDFELEPTPDVATALYTGIYTDTGRFAFNGTTPAALRAAAELIEHGAEYELVAREVYHRTDERVVRALGRVLTRMELHDGARVAVSHMEPDEIGVDHEGFVNHLLDIDSVEVAALLRPLHNGAFKVSLRSAGRVDVSRLASRISGGGHRLAAGGQLDGDTRHARERIRDLCVEAVHEALAAESSGA